MNTGKIEIFTGLSEEELSEIEGGTRAGNAVAQGLSWAAGGMKFGRVLGPWGAVGGAVIGGALGAYVGYN